MHGFPHDSTPFSSYSLSLMSSCLATCHLPSTMAPSQVRFTVSQYYHYTRIANARRLLHHPSTRLRQPATCRHYTSSATPCSRASTLYTANTSYRNWHCSKWTQHGSIAVTRSFYRTSDQDNEPLPPKNDGTTPQMLQEDELLGYFARLSNPRTVSNDWGQDDRSREIKSRGWELFFYLELSEIAC